MKRLELVERVEDLLAYRVKPNLRVLGPRLGSRVGRVGTALQEADAAALVAQLRTAGRIQLEVDGTALDLSEDDVLVESVAPAGYRVEQDGTRAVALRVELDDALREEGLVREVVHAVQLCRKEAGLRIEDTIDLALALPAELQDLARRHATYIRTETLASALSLEGGERVSMQTVRVEGQPVVVGITATGTIFTESYG